MASQVEPPRTLDGAPVKGGSTSYVELISIALTIGGTLLSVLAMADLAVRAVVRLAIAMLMTGPVGVHDHRPEQGGALSGRKCACHRGRDPQRYRPRDARRRRTDHECGLLEPEPGALQGRQVQGVRRGGGNGAQGAS